jgi:hypothetical protein
LFDCLNLPDFGKSEGLPNARSLQLSIPKANRKAKAKQKNREPRPPTVIQFDDEQSIAIDGDQWQLLLREFRELGKLLKKSLGG